MDNRVIYFVVVFLYNEEFVVNVSYRRLKKVMDIIKEKYEILFINDGSKDNIRKMVEDICSVDENIKFVNFLRNFGY